MVLTFRVGFQCWSDCFNEYGYVGYLGKRGIFAFVMPLKAGLHIQES